MTTAAAGESIRTPEQELVAVPGAMRTNPYSWSAAKIWLRRGIGLAITAAIFVWMLKPIFYSPPEVRHRVLQTNWWRVLGASVMFAGFLFIFRALAWRRILISFGHRLPVAAATRIWSTSELARYLPGVIWQVVGRAYLAKPYGVSGSVCSTSQVLELAIFLLANLITAVSCLLFMGLGQFHGTPRHWLLASTALVPVLIYLVHPKVFYPLVNRVMARLGKPIVEQCLGFRETLGLLLWSIIGLLWQGLAIWLVVCRLLELEPSKWWVVTGAYCLAWCAGFLAFWAPGGIGVREAVFVGAMRFALSHAFRHRPIGAELDPLHHKEFFLVFLSVLLRIWATIGEMMVAATAYALDYRGALGKTPASPMPDR